MRKSSIFVLLFFLAAATGSRAQSIDSVAAPAIWLRADQGNISSVLWPDRSGNKRDATALSGEGPSDKGIFNYNKALIFDGINDYMKIPYSLEALSGLTMIAVYESADTTERGIWGVEKGVSRNSMLSTKRVLGPDSLVDMYGNFGKIPALNTIVQNWTKTATLGEGAYLALGSAGKERPIKPFKGAIAEVMVFDRVLPFLERLQIESYLAIKYGIPLQASNYLSSAQQVLWHGENNKALSTRITGIGRDDAFGLYQKQAKSSLDTTAFLKLSAGSLASSNTQNKTVIPNGHFLVWGDNGMGLTTKPGLDSILSFVDRKWLIAATGNTVHQLPTELQIDASLLPTEALGYWLVIDRSGQGNFAVDNLEYIFPTHLSKDSIAFFKNLKWDTDRSGKDNYGFVRAQHMLALVKANPPSCTNPTAGSATFSVVAGKAPFQYQLTNAATGLFREWKTENMEQKGLSTGEYTLKVTGADGYQVTRTFTLSMPDALKVDLGKDQALVGNQNIVLDATTYIPDSVLVSYRWQNSFGFSSKEGKINVTQSGVYKVFVTNEKGCVFSDEIIISGAAAQRFEVFPTLVSKGGLYNVSVSLEQSAPINIKVFDAKGMLYQARKGDSQAEYHFILPVKEPGMYMVVLQTSKGVETRKLVVQ